MDIYFIISPACPTSSMERSGRVTGPVPPDGVLCIGISIGINVGISVLQLDFTG